jgi:hypothetical protein
MLELLRLKTYKARRETVEVEVEEAELELSHIR